MRKTGITKLVISTALAGTLIFGLTACGDSDADKAEATTAAAATEATTAAPATEATTAEAATEATTAAPATEATTAAPATEATTAAAATEATTAAPATEATTAAAATTNVDYSGTYAESYAGRGIMTITAEGDWYCIEVNWAGSAAEKGRWLFHGNFDENGYLAYSDCYKQHYVYDEDGNETITEEYTNGSGSIQYSNGSITWADAQEDIANGSTFVKQ